MPNAACNTTFVYLSNLETILFEHRLGWLPASAAIQKIILMLKTPFLSRLNPTTDIF